MSDIRTSTCLRGHDFVSRVDGKIRHCLECAQLRRTGSYERYQSLGRTCLRGHLVDGDNAISYSHRKGGYRCRECQRVWQATAIERLVTQVRAAYGDACECCGETEPDFLCLDHRGGGGGVERRSGAGSGKSTWALARREGYPRRFRLLCWNCNYGMTRPGGCAHQRTVRGLMSA